MRENHDHQREGYKGNKYRLINIIEKEGFYPFGFSPYIFFSEDGSSIFSSYQDNSIIQLDINTGSIINAIIPADSEIGQDHSASFSVSSDRMYCAIWNIEKNPPRIINIQSREIVWKMPDDIECVSLLFSSDNKYIITENEWSGVLTVWDFPKHQKLRDIFAGVRTCAISPDNNYIVSRTDSDYDMVMCRIDNGEIVQEFSGHEDQVEYVAFTPDGKKKFEVAIKLLIWLTIL